MENRPQQRAGTIDTVKAFFDWLYTGILNQQAINFPPHHPYDIGTWIHPRGGEFVGIVRRNDKIKTNAENIIHEYDKGGRLLLRYRAQTPPSYYKSLVGEKLEREISEPLPGKGFGGGD